MELLVPLRVQCGEIDSDVTKAARRLEPLRPLGGPVQDADTALGVHADDPRARSGQHRLGETAAAVDDVARTHQGGKSHTYSVVGTLASIEPLRSRTVLQIMDGLRGVWHGGPFARTTRYVFYPRQIMFGTDPVAIDRLLLDIIDNKRRDQGAISIWDRSPSSLKIDDGRARDADLNVNIIIREPGHVEFASSLGLGVHDIAKIKVQDVTV